MRLASRSKTSRLANMMMRIILRFWLARENKNLRIKSKKYSNEIG